MQQRPASFVPFFWKEYRIKESVLLGSSWKDRGCVCRPMVSGLDFTLRQTAKEKSRTLTRSSGRWHGYWNSG